MMGFKRSILWILFALTGTGCTLFQAQSDQVATYAGKVVKGYCENTTADVRAEIRAAVNAKAAPHSVTVTCASPAVN